MTLTTRMRMTVPTIIVAAGVASGVLAQTTTANPHHPDTTRAQATSGQGQDAQPAQPGMMRPGMTGEAMVGQGMLGGMPMMGRRGHMLKVIFAIADTDSDGALSFEEVTAIHKRIFTRVDINKDGKVTVEEFQTFMRE